MNTAKTTSQHFSRACEGLRHAAEWGLLDERYSDTETLVDYWMGSIRFWAEALAEDARGEVA